MIIDSHHHFWEIGKNGHEWPTKELEPIFKDFTEIELNQTVKDLSIIATILVQSQPNDLDTDYMLESTLNSNIVKGIVAWADLTSESFETRLSKLISYPKFKGLRPMLQNLEQDDWILRKDIKPAIKLMTENKLTFDALVFTRHLAFLYEFAKQNPNLKIVINHMAKPAIKEYYSNPQSMIIWQHNIAKLSKLPNVYCKISGLYTEMGELEDYEINKLYITYTLKCFPSERLMWGSDWPVILLKNEYSHWSNFIYTIIRDMDIDLQNQILWKTANNFYNLGIKNG